MEQHTYTPKHTHDAVIELRPSEIENIFLTSMVIVVHCLYLQQELLYKRGSDCGGESMCEKKDKEKNGET